MADRHRVLVVDDDPVLLDMAEEALCAYFEVTLACTGEEALEILRSSGLPDLILLDIDMPGMDGFETLLRIRDIPGAEDIPVIYLTGISGNDAELAGLRMGAQDYIIKPFARDNLLVRIQLRIQNGQMARRLKHISEHMYMGERDEARFNTLSVSLTHTERDVARMIVMGHDNVEIARDLHYSSGYVKNITTAIYDKLGVRGRRELRSLFSGG